MNNFSINTNFDLDGFNNSINDFNDILSGIKNNTDKSLNEISAGFGEAMNSVQAKNNGMVQKEASPFIGLDSVNAQKIEMSPAAKMASDIGTSLKNSLENLSAVEKKADDDIETFASGGDISIHEVMISAQKSQLAMQMALQLRNQVVSAYQEFKSMSV